MTHDASAATLLHMPKKDSQAPATKGDISLLMDSIAKLYDANEGWKNEILTANEGWKKEILTAHEGWKDEIISEFHIVSEDIRHDVGGAQSDRITAVEHDVLRLKKHTGLTV